ncbi:MAG: hypothetical protein U0Z17_10390 [Bacteroidales bacterium]
MATKGNNTFNDFDNGDFGFNNQAGECLSFLAKTHHNYDGKGLTKNYGGGTTTTIAIKAPNLTSSYFYNQTQLDFVQKSLRQTFWMPTTVLQKYDTLKNDDFRSSHSIGTRFEQELTQATV